MRDTTRLERASMAVKGDRAELRLEAGQFTITKRAATKGDASSVSAAVHEVRGATVEKPSRGQRGWFHLSVVGGTVLPPTELAASADPYTFPITGRDVAAAKRVARLVADHVRKRGLPAESAAAALESSSGVSIASRGGAATTPAPAGPAAHAEPPAAPAADAAAAQAPVPPPPATPATSTPGTVPDLHLCELADLHRAGVLTDEEYARARVRVTARAAVDDHQGAP